MTIFYHDQAGGTVVWTFLFGALQALQNTTILDGITAT